MAVAKRNQKRLVRAAYFIPVLLFFVWGGVGDFWNGRLPTVPDEGSGRIYVLHFHGTDGYANTMEMAIFYSLPLLAIALGIIINELDL